MVQPFHWFPANIQKQFSFAKIPNLYLVAEKKIERKGMIEKEGKKESQKERQKENQKERKKEKQKERQKETHKDSYYKTHITRHAVKERVTDTEEIEREKEGDYKKK